MKLLMPIGERCESTRVMKTLVTTCSWSYGGKNSHLRPRDLTGGPMQASLTAMEGRTAAMATVAATPVPEMGEKVTVVLTLEGGTAEAVTVAGVTEAVSATVEKATEEGSNSRAKGPTVEWLTPGRQTAAPPSLSGGASKSNPSHARKPSRY